MTRVHILSVISIAILLLSACNSEKKKIKPYQFKFNFKQEVEKLKSLNPKVKRFAKITANEEISFDTINWDWEFKFFLENDIHKPIHLGMYKEIIDTFPDYIKATYNATKDDQKVRSTVYEIVDGNIVKVQISAHEDNGLNYSNYELEYIPMKSYAINGVEGMSHSHETPFNITGEIHLDENRYIGRLDIGAEDIPFYFFSSSSNGPFQINNGDERIDLITQSSSGDTLRLKFPSFDSYLIFHRETMKGYWYYPSKGNYNIPLSFDTAYAMGNVFQTNYADVSGNWETVFSENTEDEYKAVGKFIQSGNRLKGTFLTETGDYRYLNGFVDNGNIQLSCFDGAHAFLFKSSGNDNKQKGIFYSGKHWTEPWVAVKNDNFSLSNPDSLSWVKPDVPVAFQFSDVNGNMVSLSDSKFENKVKVIQVLGTWCPNCLDESKFLVELLKSVPKEKIEVIGLAFERDKTQEKRIKRVKDFVQSNNFPSNYNILIAGRASKKEAAEALPFLNHVMSFPTTILLDQKNNVINVHTGFNGPGTGGVFEEFSKNYKLKIQQLI
ncbi:MAG: TlpA family protein disulfide reductase [Flavobacteriales bacterium]|nr:TlpA family protein disulfide reductase [Flavobacteriales bacterium]